MHDMIFFSCLSIVISSVGSSLLASKKSKNIYCGEKYRNYPLTTLGDRFASCENIVSRSQTSSRAFFAPFLYFSFL